MERREKMNTTKRHIVFVCDVGMALSAMGAAVFRKKLQQAHIQATVTHCALRDLPTNVEVVVTQQPFVERVKQQAPTAQIVVVEQFLTSLAYDELIVAWR